ncbi:hypothetical protein AB0C52_36085 [Streptomyces sp. NPDC048717]|uniref:hypothetical protein n=1 Tax=Streptomyces sp. NPDC048717 TaxID=3154928 RepID=UPI00343A0357
MGKQKKGRKHRSINLTPRPVGGQATSSHGHEQACLPHQSTAPPVTERRDRAEIIDGRAYPATARMKLDGEQVTFDLIANMYAVVHGEVTGPCADILTALALAYTQDHQGLLPPISTDEGTPVTPAALKDSFRRFFQEGTLGRDEKGGFISLERLHAAHA